MTQQTNFIAVPVDDQSSGFVYGIGGTAAAAIDDAYVEAGCGLYRPSVVDRGADSDEAAAGQRYSYTRNTGEVVDGGYADEADAQAALDETGFKAIACTPSLIEAVKSDGRVDWTYNEAGLADVRAAA